MEMDLMNVKQKNNNNRIDIVYITDENYAMPTCVSIVSLIHNNMEMGPLYIHIFCDNVSQNSKEKFIGLSKDTISIILYDVCNDRFDELAKTCLSTGTHVSKSALFKFMIPLILEKLDKVLYLDGDILVLGSLENLYHTDLCGYSLAAVPDMGDSKLDNGESELAKKIGISTKYYFNSGVLLMNLKRMRELDSTDKLLKYRVEGKNNFMDQDAYNVVMQNEWLKLPYTFNFRSALFDILDFTTINKEFFNGTFSNAESLIDSQCILHLTGPLKPWKYLILYFTEIFQKYYDFSPYKDRKIMYSSPVLPMYIENFNLKSEIIYLMKCQNLMQWTFPTNKISMHSKIVLYGAGKVGRSLKYQNDENHFCSIVLWVDKQPNMEDNIFPIQNIVDVEFDKILIALSREEVVADVRNALIEFGIPEGKIVTLF